MSGIGNQRPSGLKQPAKIGKASSNSTSTTSRTPHESEKNFGDFSHSYALASAIFTNDDWPMRKKISDASLVLTENTDDFIIGDRVWVGGTKGGHIQYIGETQFAPGEWAGVVLDDAVGKNDGSVAGVRYFMCESKRGVFSRLTKLSREPIQHLIDEERDTETTTRTNGSSSGRNSPLFHRASSPVTTLSSMAKRFDSTSSPHGSTSNLSAIEGPLKVGVRVLVQSANGTKSGILRFLGVTDFATGEWAGVELDEPIGKNDGSVAGRRYFTCKSKYGLFAPTHKVSRTPGTPLSKHVSNSTRSTFGSGLARRTGSHESLNSSLSSASNTARAARVRLGITSLSSQKSPLKSNVRPSLGATQNAMQEALKEKEQHIEQLLKERDMERAEVAKAAVQVEDSERKLNAMKNEYQVQVEDAEKRASRYRLIAENSDTQRKELMLQLEEEKRKVEDLQFRVEEESISKGDLESISEADAQKIKNLQSTVEDEKKRYQEVELKLRKTQDIICVLKDEAKELKNQLRESENNVRQLQSTKEEVGDQASQISLELNRKEKKLFELERKVESSEKIANEFKKEIKKMEELLEDKINKAETFQKLVDCLTSKLKISEEEGQLCLQELKLLQLNYADNQRKLLASEHNLELANTNKEKLEQDITNLMKNSGSYSEQLSKMNDELRSRESAIEELNTKLQNSSQQIAKLQDTLEQVQQHSKQELEQEKSRHKEELDTVNNQIHTMTLELKRTQSKMQQKSQTQETEIEHINQKKKIELAEMQNEIESRDSQIGMLSHQLRDVRRHVQDLAQRNLQETEVLEGTIKKLRSDNDNLVEEKDGMYRREIDFLAKIEHLESENEKIREQYQQNESAVKERDCKLVELTAETERLRLEFSNHRMDLKKKLAENHLEEQAMHDMREQLEMQCKMIDELQASLLHSEKMKSELIETIKSYEALQTQNTQLESTSSGLKQQIRELKHKLNDIENEKSLLHLKLTASQDALLQKEDEHKKQVTKMQSEKKNLQMQEQEQEKLHLTNKIVELQVALERTKENASSTDSVADKYKEEKLAAEGQIEFLNSVIVDMQKKNDQLQARIEALESPTFGDDINLNGIKTPVVLPRLFCDICDLFDLHDTEDCPRQASPDSPPASQHHGNRNQVRPYCDICEVFGHWTNQCNDDEMF